MYISPNKTFNSDSLIFLRISVWVVALMDKLPLDLCMFLNIP